MAQWSWGESTSDPSTLFKQGYSELLAQHNEPESKDGDSAGNLKQCSVIFIVQKCFLMFNDTCISVCDSCLWSSQWAHLETVWLCPLFTLRSFSESCFLSWVSSDGLVHGVVLQLQDLFSFLGFLLACFSSLLSSLGMAARLSGPSSQFYVIC